MWARQKSLDLCQELTPFGVCLAQGGKMLPGRCRKRMETERVKLIAWEVLEQHPTAWLVRMAFIDGVEEIYKLSPHEVPEFIKKNPSGLAKQPPAE